MPLRDVIGHRTIVALLARSIERGSLPPSLIFAGPGGVGKRLAALATAQAVNCLDPRRAPGGGTERIAYDACGVCAACSRIARGIHPDVILLEPDDKGSIKIEAVRDAIDKAGYRPFEGRRRVVIIDDAEALTDHAQSAMLKTLEEPTNASSFILVTARPDALLPTVLSRCPRLRFQPLGPDDVAAALIKAGRSPEDAHAIAAIADGSIGRALDADSGDLAQARAVALRVLTDVAAHEHASRRIDSAKDLLAGTGKGNTPAEDRVVVKTHLRAIASLLRDVELIATGADRAALANPDMQPQLERLSAFHGDRGMRAFTAVDDALHAVERNAGIKTVADWLVVNV